MELKELNWLCKHEKYQKQQTFQWIFVLNSIKHKFFNVSIINQRFSDVFRKRPVPWSELKTTCPVNIYLFKVNNRNTKKRCEVCSKLTIKTPERLHWPWTYFNSVSIIEFEQVIVNWVAARTLESLSLTHKFLSARVFIRIVAQRNFVTY